MKSVLRIAAGALFVCAGLAQTVSLVQQIGERLTANGLKADVSFLASDALEGRATPSKGLDIAAEYIAAEFRRAGLEPAGDDGYFQTAPFATVTPKADGFAFTLDAGGLTIHADKGAMSIQVDAVLDLKHAGAFKLSAAASEVIPEQVKGKVLLVEIPDASDGFKGYHRLLGAAAQAQAVLVVMVRSAAQPTSQDPQLIDTSSVTIPAITVADPAIRAAVAAAKPGPMNGAVSVHIPAPAAAAVKLRNVAGVLRGSDPLLKDTYVALTAHYDHLGILGAGDGGQIYNGANDDASGTASVIEIANALTALPSGPKRSILFLALFGEERGELGSRYYAQHPVFPLAKTLADVNLEQLGRTDESGERPKIGQFNLTGFDFTNLPAIFRKCGERTGIRVVKDEAGSDLYFARGDNVAFAEAGVPSTTISVTYDFSDYHATGDKWPKLDYQNMAKVDRTIALAVYQLADSTEEPQWNAENPKTEAYRKARAK